MIDPAQPDFNNTPVSDRRPRYDYAPADRHAAPAATIITPFFNTGAVFHETARSVLQQSLQQWEWLVVNDGSTDQESLAVLDSYRSADRRLRVIDLPSNQGKSVARNTGYRAARSEYVVQLDSDDLLEPTAVEKWLWFLVSHPQAGFVTGFSVRFGAQEQLFARSPARGAAFLRGNQMDISAMVRRSVHHAVGGFDDEWRIGCEDWEFWMRCANAGLWGGNVPEYLSWYRRRSKHTRRDSTWKTQRRLAIAETLRRRYPRLWEQDFPHLSPRLHLPYETVPDTLPWTNPLRKSKPRLLLVVPCLDRSGDDTSDLPTVEQLVTRGWEVSIVATEDVDSSALPAFTRLTPDVFILGNVLHPTDYPRFLRYLIQSRQMDALLLSGSPLGYDLLPYLTMHVPDLVCVADVRRAGNNDMRRCLTYGRCLDLTVGPPIGSDDDQPRALVGIPELIAALGQRKGRPRPVRQVIGAAWPGPMSAAQAVELARLRARAATYQGTPDTITEGGEGTETPLLQVQRLTDGLNRAMAANRALREELVATRSARDRAETQLNRLRGSLSWRVTGLLRAVGALARRIAGRG